VSAARILYRATAAEHDPRVTDPLEGRRTDVAARLGPVLGFMRALWQLNHGLESRSKRMKARLGVSGPERFVLRLIGELPDVSPGQLAEIMHLDPSSLTGILRRLVSRRLVSRRASDTDARRALLRLTARGAQLDRLRSGTVEVAIRAALDALPPRDVATAVVVLRTLSGLLADEAPAAARRGAPRVR
jgi:DNA-binding MarR family transcriptional regulator